MPELTVFEPAQIEEVLNQIAEQDSLNRRRWFMTVRVAIAGGPVSPPLHETMAALGREQVLDRLQHAIEALTGDGELQIGPGPRSGAVPPFSS
ncbi:TetR/AcrR family transcriptional regulator C-terminal domain-containing protein [Kribbella sp. CA-294648]|uniref:TetR/AcrR family transcriptional regulator C-terminal domain-containing protein n=1 Tax=Kribbella sp. CA-294648 TaxID=3239948 RepID=UPI003D8DF751